MDWDAGDPGDLIAEARLKTGRVQVRRVRVGTRRYEFLLRRETRKGWRWLSTPDTSRAGAVYQLCEMQVREGYKEGLRWSWSA